VLERLLERLTAPDREPTLAVGALEGEANGAGAPESPRTFSRVRASAPNLLHLRHLLSLEPLQVKRC